MPDRSTSRSSIGALYLGCVALVVAFGSSSALAAAYGLAVAGVMLITSLAMFADRAALLAMERGARPRWCGGR